MSRAAFLVDPQLYPFTGHFFDTGGGVRMHYLDEGAGPPLVMLHGNPTWSFFYRDLVLRFRDRHHCIVPDHVGCGLADKPRPDRYPYSLDRRIGDVAALIDHLGLDRDVTLVVHDWGGMIGLGWATRVPERIKRLVILNTAAFHLPTGKPLPFSLRVGRSPLGPVLIRGLNLFCRLAAAGWATVRPLSREVRRMYLAPYDSWAHRIAVERFVQTIPVRPGDPGYDIVSQTEERLPLLHDRPALVCWGMRDFVFDADFLAEWQRRLPAAQVHRYEDAGHYILEDVREEVLARVDEILAADGLTRGYNIRHPEETPMTAAEIVEELRPLGQESYRNVIRKHGARDPMFGVKIEHLKKVQKRVKKDYQLALDLYDTGIYDCMYLAGLIADDERMTKKDLQKWVDGACMPLCASIVAGVAAEGPFGREVAPKWIESKKESVAAAGWATLGFLVALKDDADLDLADLKKLMGRIKTTIHKQPNRVRYQMNSFLVSVGVYVTPLTTEVLKTAAAIGKVTVDMGDTECKVPSVAEYVNKVKKRGSLGKKRKTVKC